MTATTPAPRRSSRRAAAPAAAAPGADPAVADEVGRARLHLRMGLLRLAQAELEELAARSELDPAGLAALAEARWRGGDLAAAAGAASASLDAGGDDPVAIVIAAEHAAVEGHPGLARSLSDRLAALDADGLEALFRGMPRRAFWPAAPGGSSAPATLFPSSDVPDHAHVHVGGDPGPDGPAGPTADRGPGSTVGRSVAHRHAHDAGHHLHRDPTRELARARAELEVDVERACVRLALVLRSDPSTARAVLAALELRRDPASAVVRGDALRLMGRHLEAEAAYAQGAAALAQADDAAASPATGATAVPGDADAGRADATARAMRRRRRLPGRDDPSDPGRSGDPIGDPAPGQTALPLPPAAAVPADPAGDPAPGDEPAGG
jgi:hypothetical protein